MSSATDAHWTVLGAGAIGCLFAHYLQRAGSTVTLLRRRDTPANDISIELGGAAQTLSLPQETAASCAPIEHLLVTTKAYDVRHALHSVADKLHADTPVVILVNGMGLREEVLADHPQLLVYCGTTTEGAHRVAAGRIRHAGHGKTYVGGFGGDDNNATLPPQWFSPWQQGVSDCHWDAQIDRALWHKLAINCAINPLTAVHRCNNGELAQRPQLAAEVVQLCREISRVSYAAGYTATAQTIEQATMEVIQATSANRSSMLQDVVAGRQTEIDYITGYFLSVAAAHGVPAPRNTDLFEQVKTLEY